MKIALVAPYFPPDVTGSSVFVADLGLELRALGHDVRVVIPEKEATSDDGLLRVEIPSRNISPGSIAFGYRIPVVFGRRGLTALRNFFDDFQPDVVSVHGQMFDICIASLVHARRRGIPTVVTVHSAIWHDRFLKNSILAMADRLLASTWLKRSTSRWVSVDNRTFQHTLQRYSSQTDVIPIGVQRNRFQGGNPSLARQKYELDGEPIIASIGHVMPVRNRHPLIRALPQIAELFPKVQVVVAGRVADDSFLELANVLGVGRHLRVLGPVPHDDIKHILASSKLEVHDLQGFGLGIGSLEPLDAGVPILAYALDNNLPGMSLRQYCSDSFLLSNDPALLASTACAMLKDDAFRETVLARQQRLLEDVYYIDVVAKRYSNLFEEVLIQHQI